jgi:hypothetical protein
MFSRALRCCSGPMRFPTTEPDRAQAGSHPISRGRSSAQRPRSGTPWRWLLDELEDEELWARQFATSQDALSKLVAEARADRAAGRATELDPDKL